jgi:chlorobactene glucosyltransferase
MSQSHYNGDMNTNKHSNGGKWAWLRLLLWTHTLGVIAFYLILWFRTNPNGGKMSVKQAPDEQNVREDEAFPAVSILVPARNEEQNIRRCVESLLVQDYDGPYEVIVVNDGSTDATSAILAEIAQYHPKSTRLKVLQLHEQLPDGWAGKPHAIHSGTKLAHGDWLLFTDADTWHAPGALRFAMRKARAEHADLLTLSSEQELPGFWNKVMMPMAFMGISMLYPVKLVNDPRSPVAIANGQFILIRRAIYDLLGGYARPDLRGTLLDDRDLARVVKENGFQLRFEDGRSVVHVRMYNNLNETWHGWRKNAFLGNRGGLPFVLVQLIGLPVISIVPFLLPFLGLRVTSRGVGLPRPKHLNDDSLLNQDFGRGKPTPLLVTGRMNTRYSRGICPREISIAALMELTPLLAYRLWLNKSLNVPWYYAATHPLGGALFEGILAQSAWRIITHKGVDWRGRQYYGAQ